MGTTDYSYQLVPTSENRSHLEELSQSTGIIWRYLCELQTNCVKRADARIIKMAGGVSVLKADYFYQEELESLLFGSSADLGLPRQSLSILVRTFLATPGPSSVLPGSLGSCWIPFGYTDIKVLEGEIHFQGNIFPLMWSSMLSGRPDLRKTRRKAILEGAFHKSGGSEWTLSLAVKGRLRSPDAVLSS